MQVFKIHHPYIASDLDEQPVVLAMGFFDGVHLGHQAVLTTARAVAEEQDLPLAVLTYNQHPSLVFKKQPQPFKYLIPLKQKLNLFEEFGVNRVFVVDFTSQLAALSPQEFVEQYMVGLHAQTVVAGFDHTFGPRETANMQTLPLLAEHRFEVVEVPRKMLVDEEASSTNIRKHLGQREVTAVNHLLGRIYTTDGVVVHGDARGRQMGFPTLNIVTPENELLPGDGVYVVEVLLNNQWYGGMAQIGYNVTFEANRAKTLEINLFGFHGEVYGEHVQIRWHQFLRLEAKFAGMDALTQQLLEDQKVSQAYLAQL
ncbi:riboflavin biosynthesis protein RibF [Weissella kandleri]|uniref:riboflavin biosynthesis protein RibF n=1 Tax=Weissella kandleri TaxID=1616 RepID=UPI00387ED2DD